MEHAFALIWMVANDEPLALVGGRMLEHVWDGSVEIDLTLDLLVHVNGDGGMGVKLAVARDELVQVMKQVI